MPVYWGDYSRVEAILTLVDQIEHFFQRIKRYRRVATRYDKPALDSEGSLFHTP